MSRLRVRPLTRPDRPVSEACERVPGAAPLDPFSSADERLTPVARGAAANLFGAVVSAAANFGLVLVVARGLTPRSAGVFFAATSLFVVVEAVGRLGADTGLVYFIARWRAMNMDDRIRAVLRVAIAPVLIFCGAVAIIAVPLAPHVARLIGSSRGDDVALLRVLALVLPLAAAYNVALGASRGFAWMRPTVLVDKIGRGGLQLALVGAVIAFGRIDALGYAWALPYVAGFVVMTALLRNAVRTRLPLGLPGVVPRVGREFWAFTLPRALATIAQAALQRLDIVLVAVMRGAADAAIYTAATRFLVVAQLINQAITAPVQPQLSDAFTRGDVIRARRLYQISTAWLVLASWPVLGLAAVYAPLYLSVFGHGYSRGTAVVVILAVAMLVASGVGLVDTVIIMAGRSSWNLQTTLGALAVNVGVDLALIPRWGMVGAAIGWLGSILAANLVPLLIAWRRLSLHPFGAVTNRAFALCGTCWVAVPIASALLTDRSAAGAAFAVVLGLLLYCVGVFRLRSCLDLRGLIRRRVHDTVA